MQRIDRKFIQKNLKKNFKAYYHSHKGLLSLSIQKRFHSTKQLHQNLKQNQTIISIKMRILNKLRISKIMSILAIIIVTLFIQPQILF